MSVRYGVSPLYIEVVDGNVEQPKAMNTYFDVRSWLLSSPQGPSSAVSSADVTLGLAEKERLTLRPHEQCQ